MFPTAVSARWSLIPLYTATDASPDRHPAGFQFRLRGSSRVLVIGDLLNQWSAPAPKRHPSLS